MKRLKHLFTAMLLLCSTVAMAHDFEVDGIYYNITDAVNKTIEVTYIGNYYYEYPNEYTGSVVIPESVTHNGTTYGVTSIGDYAFDGCFGLTSIEIPNSVTSIGDYAFSECSGLTSIEIPNSVTSIGTGAFGACTGLEKITVESGNTVYDSRENCNAIIETETNALIAGCKNSVIPDGVTSIEDYAFYDCSGLESIEIPNSVTSIGEGAFCRCFGLESIEIPNSVTSIGTGAFDGCSSLTSIEIPNSVTSIEVDAFAFCSGLTSIEIPNSVTSIEVDAFAFCSSLTSIEIPNSVTSIGGRAFCGCTGLEKITVESGNTVYDSRENCNAIIETETNALIAGCKNSVIPDGVTSIGGYAFIFCSGLTSIEIPNGVTRIGNYAFLGCSGLESIEIPNSVTRIGDVAFSNCTALTSIISYITAENLFAIDSDTFYGVDKAACTLYVPGGAKETYATTDGWSEFANIVTIIGVFLDRETVTLTDGETTTLAAVVNVDGATDKDVVWSTSNNAVATVEGCVVTAVAPGTATITAIVGEYSASCVVTVTGRPVASLSELNNNSVYHISQPHHSKGATSWAVETDGNALKSNTDLGIELNNNDPRQQFLILSNDGGATYYLYHAAEAKYICKDGSLSETAVDAIKFMDGAYSNTFFAYFDNSHYVNVGGSRQMTIDDWSTADGGNSCELLPVAEYITGISLDSDAETIIEGETFTLTATVASAYPTDKILVWETSDSSVATVEGGVVTAVAPGTTTITATAGGYSASCVVTVEERTIAVTGISLDSDAANIIEGETFTLTATVTPDNALENVLVWRTSDSAVATVEGGVVTAVAPGTATITATAGGYSASCVVTVETKKFEVDGIYYNITDAVNKTVEVTYRGNSEYEYSNEYTGSVVIPESVTHNGTTYGVTSIGNDAFYDCYGLESIEIPNSVTSIGWSAFWGCSGLTSIEIPNSVTSIGDGAFMYCYGFTSIEIPNNVTSIGMNAFWSCSGLTSITIPNSVTSIGTSVFGECSGLEKIMVESGNTVYDSRENCNAIIETETNTLIAGCKNSVIPGSVTSIGSFAFDGCSGLTSIEIPNSITSIEDYAFRACYALTSVTSYIPAENLFAIDSEVFSGVDKAACTLYVPGGAKETYATTDGWSEFVNIIDFSISEIALDRETLTLNKGETFTLTATTTPDNALENVLVWRTSDSAVATIEGGVVTAVAPGTATITATAGGYSASCVVTVEEKNFEVDGIYYNITDAVNKTVEVTYRGNSYNEYPNEYTGSVVIPESVTHNGTTYGVTSIGSRAFDGCFGLTSIEIPNSVTSIEGYAFAFCSGLTSIEIPNSVTSIGTGAFGGCTGLEKITVESGNTVYDSRENCNAIIETETNALIAGCKNSVIPDGVTSIEDYAFYDCSGLTSIEIPNSVTRIDMWAFSDCSGLTSITIGNSKISFVYAAFSNCTALTSIISYITAENLFAIYGDTFNGVDKAACTLYVPVGAKETYATTGGWSEFANIVEKDFTGIEKVKCENGEVKTVYDLQGRKVKCENGDVKGIYIINGKKVLIR